MSANLQKLHDYAGIDLAPAPDPVAGDGWDDPENMHLSGTGQWTRTCSMPIPVVSILDPRAAQNLMADAQKQAAEARTRLLGKFPDMKFKQ